MTESDLVVLSGGSSQGKKDMTADLIEKVGKPGVWTHGIALKPGKPTIIGSDDETQTLFIGLPGHPVAAMMVFELLILWLQRHLQGQAEASPILAKLESNIPAAPGRATCQAVKLLLVEDGYLARPIYGKSGLMSSLTQADGYVVLPVNQEGLQTGATVYVNLL
jgi:molybdopterin molybdotransferase